MTETTADPARIESENDMIARIAVSATLGTNRAEFWQTVREELRRAFQLGVETSCKEE